MDGALERNTQPSVVVHISPERVKMVKKGHQRGFSLSAATTSVAESVRKHLFKKNETPHFEEVDERGTRFPEISAGRIRRTHSQISSRHPSASNMHKRATASQSTIVNNSIAPIRSMTPRAPSPRTMTGFTTSRDGRTGPVHKPLPVQPLSAHPPSIRSDVSSATTEYAAVPEPKTRRLGGLLPPTKAQLNTVVARQQSRIVDLTLQNNMLAGQIDALRQEVESIKRAGSPSVVGSMRYQPGKDSRRQSTYTEGWEDCE